MKKNITILPDDIPTDMFPCGAPESEPCILPDKQAGRRLTHQCQYRAEDGTLHEAPEGFAWNGADIPALLWPLASDPFSPDIEIAVLFHDLLCSTANTPAKRLLADNLFREILRRQKRVCSPRRWMLYRGVRIGAWWKFLWKKSVK
jgi:hypothetical protein